ncbi:MAG: hypothetical protein IKB34_09675 [Clostridia bacterium]|nr:hypothetical protein [Clostridia bacterium]
MNVYENNDRSAILNALIIAFLSACIMFAAIGAYRLTAGKHTGQDGIKNGSGKAEVSDSAGDKDGEQPLVFSCNN